MMSRAKGSPRKQRPPRILPRVNMAQGWTERGACRTRVERQLLEPLAAPPPVTSLCSAGYLRLTQQLRVL